ncbi:MAG: D-2-hydroxyacid dehydrogenase [Planctomycetota bacterium]
MQPPFRALILAAAAAASACSSLDPAPPAEALPGTLDGAQVALDPATVGGPPVYLAGNLSPEEVEQYRALAPNLELLHGLDRTTALEHAPRAHGADAHLLSAEFMERAEQLAWIQSWSAGVGRLLETPGVVEREGLVVTNAKGVHGPVISEHVFALLLSLTRNLGAYAEAQADSRWDRNAGDPWELSGRTLLVAGLGGIGREVAKRADAFGMRVVGTVRTEREAPPYVDQLVTGDRTDEFLPEADVLVICLPLTDETRGFFDARRLALLPPGAVVINIARGAILDTDALHATLQSGHLAGAGLDVTDPEPLPADHPLWSTPNVRITPHVAGRADLTGERRRALLAENIRRFAAGEPLLNVVDREAGY